MYITLDPDIFSTAFFKALTIGIQCKYIGIITFLVYNL